MEKTILIRDFIMGVCFLGGAIAATVLTHFGVFEVLYYIPFILFELDDFFFVKKLYLSKYHERVIDLDD